ncbi:hypothetical protein NOVO_01980 [Rickettsiales bacterium Ac37b]|nr:hypothetical protein NOVO_01980 [Rickettsiales bacterium Ac37b]
MKEDDSSIKRKSELDYDNQSTSKKPRAENQGLQDGSNVQILDKNETRDSTNLSSPLRKLDSLARLVAGNAKCAAILFDGERLLVSTNKLHATTGLDLNENPGRNLILQVMDYFANISVNQGRDLGEQESLLKSITTLYIKGSLEKGYREEFDDYTEQWVSKFLAKNGDQSKELVDLTPEELKEIGAEHVSGAYKGEAAQWIKRLYKDLIKVETYVLAEPKDSQLRKAFNHSNYHLDYVGRMMLSQRKSMILIESPLKVKHY